MNVVLASANAGKLAELRSLLAPLGFDLVSQSSLGVESAAEERLTFLENALDKARHVARLTGRPALADDSGLVVPALGGAPGIRSARYAGDAASDADNNRKLVDALAGVQDRRAHYYCALVLLRHADDPAPVVTTASWHGTLIDRPRGSHGFGYDAHFLIADMDRTAAELDPATKNRLSHRGRATEALLARLRDAG